MKKTISREELVRDLKDNLVNFLSPNETRPNSWLACKVGDVYVRKGTRRAHNGITQSCVDIANVNLINIYRGNGIMTELLDWLVTLPDQYSAVYVESIVNTGFCNHLKSLCWEEVVGDCYLNLSPNLMKVKPTL